MFRILLMVAALSLTATVDAAEAIPFRGQFKIPALRVVWAALNEANAEQMKVGWRDLAPRKDTSRPDECWRHWPSSCSPFYAGTQMPADAFTLAARYPDGKLVYPQATYDPNVD